MVASDDGASVYVTYQPPDAAVGVPFPRGPLQVPTDIFLDVISPPPYVTLDVKTARTSFAFVTAASDHFFTQSLATIQTVQEYFPNRPIVFYDLGISKEKIETVSGYSDGVSVCQASRSWFLTPFRPVLYPWKSTLNTIILPHPMSTDVRKCWSRWLKLFFKKLHFQLIQSLFFYISF